MPLGDAGREMARGLRTPARVTAWIADSVGECVRPLGQQFLPGHTGLYHSSHISTTIIYDLPSRRHAPAAPEGAPTPRRRQARRPALLLHDLRLDDVELAR